jgi:GNAT superfamily N-acetyltransferase
LLPDSLKGMQTLRVIWAESGDDVRVRLASAVGETLAHCEVQLHAPEADVVMWNIAVNPELRQHGVASLLVRTVFRRILDRGQPVSFALRMLQLIRPEESTTRAQNVGIGVIARKLGFSPEYNLVRLLNRNNIQLIELLESEDSLPPAYRIVLDSYPLVLLAFLVDPDTDRPFPGGHPIYYSLVTPEAAETWSRDRMIIVGNGNYVLRRNGIGSLVNHLASDPLQARAYHELIVPVR